MKKCILTVLFGILSAVCAFAGGRFYVTTSGSDSNDGKSWAKAFKDVQKAIDAAAVIATDANPSEVWIAKGTYKHGSSLKMKNNVAIYGGFAGNETSLKDRLGNGANETILSGENKYRIFNNVYTSSSQLKNSILDGVTLESGNVSYNEHGGAIKNVYVNATFSNIQFDSNEAYYGSAVYASYSNIIIDKCTFKNNVTYWDGTIYCEYNPSLILKNSTITKNKARYASAFSNLRTSKALLVNCTIVENEETTYTDENNSVVFNYSSSQLEIINTLFWKNVDSSKKNSIIRSNSSTTKIKSCVFNGSYPNANSATNIITTDPRLGTLGYNGGFVQTIPVLAGSSAIAAGASGTDVPQTDARGYDRPVPCTIGAYEYDVCYLPTITQSPSNIEVYTGKTAKLSVAAEGDNLTYQWQASANAATWSNLSGQTSSSLTIAKAASSDGKYYRCAVSNKDGTAYSESAKITVRASASITSQPVDLEVRARGNAVLSVGASGYNLSYKWQKKVSGIWLDIEGAKSSALSLKNVKFEDSGEYRCVVSNAGATVYSNAAEITVPIIFIEESPSEELIVCDSTKTTLKVVAEEVYSNKLTYTWLVNKKDGNGFVKAGSGDALSITPKTNMRGWQYYCAISNGTDFRNTNVSTITAVVAPVKIAAKPKALTAFEGNENSGFSVAATGYNVQYQWQVYKIVGYNASGKAVYDWVDIAGATSANYVPESDYANNGLQYRCKVYNEGSTAYTGGVKLTIQQAAKIYDITIFQKPETAKQAHPVEDGEEVCEYFDITLTADAAGYKIKYQWYLNGEPIKGATKKTLTIKKPMIGEYEYSCMVYNEASKGVIASYDEMFFWLIVSPLNMPMELTGGTFDVYDEYGKYMFTFGATSKSAGEIVEYMGYDYDDSVDLYDIPARDITEAKAKVKRYDYIYDNLMSISFDTGNENTTLDFQRKIIYENTSYSYKRNNDQDADFKLTYTILKQDGYWYSYYDPKKDDWIEKEELVKTTEKKTIQGWLTSFDEDGWATLYAKDGYEYRIKRSTNYIPLPNSLIGKAFDGRGDIYFNDGKSWKSRGGNSSGTYTYKKMSDSVAQLDVKYNSGWVYSYCIISSDLGMFARLLDQFKSYKYYRFTADVEFYDCDEYWW